MTPEEKRQYERYDLALPITFVCEATRKTHEGVVKNIGLGGVLLETPARLSKMERITLYLPAADAGTAKISGIVVRYHMEGAVGVAFVSLSGDDQKRISSLIEQNRVSEERVGEH